MKCPIIRDLLPLYCDKLTSPESSEEVEKHLAACPECMEVYDNMKKDLTVAVADTNIKPMKKVKKHFVRRIICSILATALVLAGVFVFAFWGVVPIHSKNLSWCISMDEVEMTNAQTDGKNEVIPGSENVEIHKFLRIHFQGKCRAFRESTNDNDIIYKENAIVINPVVTFFPILRLPFDNTTPKYTMVLDVTCCDEHVITVRCLDKKITLYAKDLIEEYERQNGEWVEFSAD